MCLGLPGRIVEITPGSSVARVEIAGVVREIDLGMLDGPFAPGDHVLIHSGFALERMTAEDAQAALSALDSNNAPNPAPDPRSEPPEQT